jgi:LuxR family maltose regulon positive regulatory protein
VILEAIIIGMEKNLILGDVSFYDMDDLASAEFAFYQGDLIRTDIFALRAIRKAREKKWYEIEIYALFYLIRINLAAGRPEQITDVLKQLEEGLNRGEFSSLVCELALGWFYIHIGQRQRIAPWLKTGLDKSNIPSLFTSLEILVRTKYFYREKHCPPVFTVPENQAEPYTLRSFFFGRIEMKVLEAVYLYHEKRKEEAFQALKEAYQTAMPNALTMPFIEMGKDMCTLVNGVIKYGNLGIPIEWLEEIRKKSTAYAKKLPVIARKFHVKANENPPLSISTVALC